VRVAKEYHLPLHYISTAMSSNSQLSNTVPVSHAMDVDQIVAQAQEQLKLVMKVQEKEWKEQFWVEEDRKVQQEEEWSRVVVADKEAAEKVLGIAVKEMWAIFCQVSSDFVWPLSQN